MEEDFSNEFNTESVTGDEMVSNVSTEDKISKKRYTGSPFKKRMKLCPTNHTESNVQFSPQSPADSKCIHTDSENSFCKIENYSPPMSVKESVIARILKIVNNPESMNGPVAYNDINRNKYARMEESKGDIQLHIISNSVSQPVADKILIWLVGLRNLIYHELPHMSRSYITRLVFDPKHRSLVIVKDNNVVGGICFRMFPSQKFSEIVFLAISGSSQFKGYGTHMMNHLKDYHIKRNILNLFTYAAEEAFGYFEKQGFSSKIASSESVYQGYINVYQHAILMECQLDQRIIYTELSEVIRWQKMIVRKLIEDYQSTSEDKELPH